MPLPPVRRARVVLFNRDRGGKEFRRRLSSLGRKKPFIRYFSVEIYREGGTGDAAVSVKIPDE